MVVPVAGAAVIKFAASPWGRTLLGTVGGLLGGVLLGGGKKQAQSASQEVDQTGTITSQPHNISTTWSPTWLYDYSKTAISDSPHAEVKKTTTQTPSTSVIPSIVATPSLTQGVSQAQEQSAGTDLVTLAIIGGVAVVAHGYVSKRK